MNAEKRAAAGASPFRFRFHEKHIKAQRLDPAEILHQAFAIPRRIPLFEVLESLARVFGAGVARLVGTALLLGTGQDGARLDFILLATAGASVFLPLETDAQVADQPAGRNGCDGHTLSPPKVGHSLPTG
jgi:hypothetical protein